MPANNPKILEMWKNRHIRDPLAKESAPACLGLTTRLLSALCILEPSPLEQYILGAQFFRLTTAREQD